MELTCLTNRCPTSSNPQKTQVFLRFLYILQHSTKSNILRERYAQASQKTPKGHANDPPCSSRDSKNRATNPQETPREPPRHPRSLPRCPLALHDSKKGSKTILETPPNLEKCYPSLQDNVGDWRQSACA